MQIASIGPLGYFWNLSPIQEALQILELRDIWIRPCNVGIKFDRDNKRPSGSYVQVYIAYTIANITLEM
eukprot:64066-Pyramimonas_sp.AAC.1